MLDALSGKTHQVITGVCLMQLGARQERLFAVNTVVTFRRLTSHQIRDYIEAVHTLDKAGAYAIQEHGDMIIRSIKGSRSNVVGLPLERLRKEVEDWSKR